MSRMQRGRAGKGGSEVGRGCRNLPTSVFRVVRARSAWGEEPEKVSRPLRAPAGVRPCASKERRAGFGSKGRRRATWNRAWAPGLPGMGCDPSAVAGLPRGLETTPRRGRRCVPESRCRGPHRDGISRAACGRYAHGIAGGEMVLHANGYGAAQHVRRKKEDSR